MPRGTKISIILTEDEEETLIMWCSIKTEKRFAQRAQVILSSSKGMSLPEVSKKSGLSRQNCSRWRMRFLYARLEGLKDLPRKGRPPIIAPEKRARIERSIQARSLQMRNRQTGQSGAGTQSGGKATAHRSLAQGEPPKIESWSGKSTEREFAEKQVAILGLYLYPSVKVLALGCNEEPQVQAIDRIRSELPSQPKNPERSTVLYMRQCGASLLAALSTHDRTVSFGDRDEHILLLKFLKRLYRSSPGSHLHIITDGNGFRQHREVMEWIQPRRRLAIYPLPTYASWLSQVEIWVKILARDVIPGGPWKSREQLVDQIIHYIRRYSYKTHRPFWWLRANKS
jgi:transposase